MPFISFTTFAAECDLCACLLLPPPNVTAAAATLNLLHRTPTAAAATAIRDGWLVTTTHLLCPACRRDQTASNLEK